MKELSAPYAINGLRRILGLREPRQRLAIELDCAPVVESDPENDGTYTITGKVLNGSYPDCPVFYYCYQDGEKSKIVWIDGEGQFSVTVPVNFNENLYTFTTVNRDGEVAGNGVVIINPNK